MSPRAALVTITLVAAGTVATGAGGAPTANDPLFCKHIKPKLVETLTMSYPGAGDIRSAEVFNLEHRYSITFTSAMTYTATGSTADPFTSDTLIWNGTRTDLATLAFSRARISDTVHRYHIAWHNTRFDKTGTDYVQAYPPRSALPTADTPFAGTCFGGEPVSTALASAEGRGLHFAPGPSASRVTGTVTIQVFDEEPGVESQTEPSTPSVPLPSAPKAPATPGAASSSSLNTAVVGKHYVVGASGRKAVPSGPTFTFAQGKYVARGVSLRLSSGFTYTSSRTGASVTGSAVLTLVLEKLSGSGSGPQTASVPLTYKVLTAAKWTPDKAAREWAFTAHLVKPNIGGCESVRLIVGKLKSSYLSFSGCGLSVFIRPATVSII